ncbi:hypothetical protein IWQ60_008769 [Tieghemiomyces parasiticus]|uniref:Uncharacterized protein n=1 Tax=Tieghemiomyces parasiticus TaxID=78921 RepID=A0A9W8DL20_9FUNG|nr:hypothetical protein IWQ60_008769 [Tieghemiomyces parasiticus]
MIGAPYRRSSRRKTKLHRNFSSTAARSVSSVASLRAYDVNCGSVSSLYQRSRLQRFVRVVQGVFGKAKLKNRSKRLDPDRLKRIQARLAAARAEHATDKKGVLAQHLMDYAPLYVLRLVSAICADEPACLKLEKLDHLQWGLRQRETIEYVPLNAVRDKLKDNLRRPISCVSGERVSPKIFLARVVQECWHVLTTTALARPSSDTSSRIRRSFCSRPKNEVRYPRQDARWFLHCFCVIYGFAAVKLHLPSTALAGQLVQIAALPMLADYQAKNEDSLYVLEQSTSFLTQMQHRLPTKLSAITLQEAFVAAAADQKAPAVKFPSYSRTVEIRPPRSSSLTGLYPVPVPTVFPAVLTQPGTAKNEGSQSARATVDASLVVGTEIVVLHLTACFTRPNAPARLTTDGVFRMVRALPRTLQTPPPLALLEELQVSIDYLLAANVPEYLRRQASHWFRESADHRKLKLINECGFEAYFERHALEGDRQSLLMPPPSAPPVSPGPVLQKARLTHCGPTAPSPLPPATRSADPMLIRLSPSNRSSCPSLPAPVSATLALARNTPTAAPLEFPELYTAYCQSYDFGAQLLASSTTHGFTRSALRRSSRGTNDSRYTENSDVTRVPAPTDDDWRSSPCGSPALTPYFSSQQSPPPSPLGHPDHTADYLTAGHAPTGFSGLPTRTPVRTNLTLVASHIKHCIQQLPDGLIPDSVITTLMQIMPEPPTTNGRAAASSVSVLGNDGSVGADQFDWRPTADDLALIRGLLALSPWRFHLLQQLAHVAQLIFTEGTKDSITPFGLAIVLPVYEASSSQCLKDLNVLRRWNWCWGCLLTRSRELFIDPAPPLVSEKDRNGFGYTMYLLKHV